MSPNSSKLRSPTPVAALLLAAALFGPVPQRHRDVSSLVSVRLSEWKVELSQSAVGAGTVRFAITNAGTIPHAFEVEGRGVEKETALIQPGASDTLTLSLSPGAMRCIARSGRTRTRSLVWKRPSR